MIPIFSELQEKDLPGLSAVEPQGCRGVVDRDLPYGELGRIGLDELVAGVDAGDEASRVGDVGAGLGEGGLGDGVVLREEDEPAG